MFFPYRYRDPIKKDFRRRFVQHLPHSIQLPPQPPAHSPPPPQSSTTQLSLRYGLIFGAILAAISLFGFNGHTIYQALDAFVQPLVLQDGPLPITISPIIEFIVAMFVNGPIYFLTG